MKCNNLLPPGDNVRLNEKTRIKCSLKMSQCMVLTIIIFPTFSGSLIDIQISKYLCTIFNFRQSHEIIISK